MGKLSSLIKKFPPFQLCFSIIFLSTGAIVCCLQGLMTILIKPFSINTYRRLNYYVTYMLNSQIVFLVDWWSGSRCIMYCDGDDLEKYFGKEPMLLIMNHSYEVDWMIGWLFCDRIGILGQAKVFMKKALKFVPIMGWTWKMQDIIFVERNWDVDKISLAKQLKRLSQYPIPYLLTIFPEGTRFTPQKHAISMEVAKSKGLPTLKHLLLPRSRGFVATVGHLRNSMPAVYDVTIALNPALGANKRPTMYSMLSGQSIVGHLLVRRIPMSEIPEDEQKAADWLQAHFRRKDEYLQNFFRTGHFNPDNKMEEFKNFQFVELPRKIYSVINVVFFFCLIIIPLVSAIASLVIFGGLVQRSIAIAIIASAYLGFQKMVNLTRIDKASSYGSAGTGGQSKKSK